MAADPGTTTEVLKALTNLFHAYRDLGINAMMEMAAPDLVVIKEGPGGVLTTPDEIRQSILKDWENMQTVSVEFEEAEVSTTGTIAWLTAECVFHFETKEREQCVPTHVTAVLENLNGRWLFRQYHVSVPSAEPVWAKAGEPAATGCV